MHMTKFGGSSEVIASDKFHLKLMDNYNNDIRLTVFGIDRISNDIVGINIEEFKSLFGDIVSTNINRPERGQIDYLVGFDLADYHPVKKSVVGGSHPYLMERSREIIKVARIFHANIRVDDFYKIEQLGVEVSPKYDSCRCR